jgi:hypothetical protein
VLQKSRLCAKVPKKRLTQQSPDLQNICIPLSFGHEAFVVLTEFAKHIKKEKKLEFRRCLEANKLFNYPKTAINAMLFVLIIDTYSRADVTSKASLYVGPINDGRVIF